MPEKIITQSDKAENYSPTRRAFHLAAIYIMGGVMAVAMAIPALVYLLIPPRQREQGWIDAGDIGQITQGEPVELTFQESRLDGWRLQTEKKTAWVVKTPSNKIVAFGPQCTHLGCAYHWEPGSSQFVCPCHTSVFSIDGKVVAGPAPRPLDQYQTKIENGRLRIGGLQRSDA
jgi:menaquinol-cytochrome c reductase iron-sulfur subunit